MPPGSAHPNDLLVESENGLWLLRFEFVGDVAGSTEPYCVWLTRLPARGDWLCVGGGGSFTPDSRWLVVGARAIELSSGRELTVPPWQVAYERPAARGVVRVGSEYWYPLRDGDGTARTVEGWPFSIEAARTPRPRPARARTPARRADDVLRIGEHRIELGADTLAIGAPDGSRATVHRAAVLDVCSVRSLARRSQTAQWFVRGYLSPNGLDHRGLAVGPDLPPDVVDAAVSWTRERLGLPREVDAPRVLDAAALGASSLDGVDLDPIELVDLDAIDGAIVCVLADVAIDDGAASLATTNIAVSTATREAADALAALPDETLAPFVVVGQLQTRGLDDAEARIVASKIVEPMKYFARNDYDRPSLGVSAATIRIRLDASWMSAPDLDLRYALPGAIVVRAPELLRYAWYDYDDDDIVVALTTSDAEQALPIVVEALDRIVLLGNRFGRAEIALADGDAADAPFRVVRPAR
jgi:hypothetical protein